MREFILKSNTTAVHNRAFGQGVGSSNCLPKTAWPPTTEFRLTYGYEMPVDVLAKW